MALHFILDGYNIIKQTPEFIDGPIDMGRERLIHAIEKHRPQGSVRNQVTVVFDGAPGRAPSPSSASVHVMFAYDRSADDRIKELVAESANPRGVIVVTNDRDIQHHVKACGGRIWTVGEFMAKMGPRQKSGGSLRAQDAGAEKGIAKTVEYSINQEMKRIWLERQKTK